jgi:hypothetical protein
LAAIPFIKVIVGGFFTVTVCVLEKLPQEFVAVSLMV